MENIQQHMIKTKTTKARFGHLFRPLAWKRNGPILEEVYISVEGS